ncbi:hypothetical protein SAMN05443144_101174 [Fodinibius roseus]|uniref:Uncharacterized protein n=1 Tax=Fodinibius roseus TaxID=1194090 RepID=A0A1M4T0F8_9BACT|nr:hypothetical protein SAMN05443144_101174 [Fodinibius roseus]
MDTDTALIAPGYSLWGRYGMVFFPRRWSGVKNPWLVGCIFLREIGPEYGKEGVRLPYEGIVTIEMEFEDFQTGRE